MPERTAIRESELARCLSLLGVTEHRWLGYRDGHWAAVAGHVERGESMFDAARREARRNTRNSAGPATSTSTATAPAA